MRVDIRRIMLAPFFSHEETDVALPDKGIVLFTGLNGAGKSALIEAVSWALWGCTLRGTKPAAGSVLVEAARSGAHVDVKRYRKKDGKTFIEVRKSNFVANSPGIVRGGPVVLETGNWRQWENATKAQSVLKETLGDFDLWRRSAVFSSVDPTTFFLAPDSMRKALLDEILDLCAFDRGLEQAKVERRALEAAAERAALNIAVAENQVATLVSQVEQMEESADCLGVDRALLEQELADCTAELKHARSIQRPLVVRDDALLTVKIGAMQREFHGMSGDACPTCDREWADLADREQRRENLRAKMDRMKGQRADLQGELANHESAITSERSIRARGQTIRDQLGILKKSNSLPKLIDQTKKKIKSLEIGLLDLHDTADAARYDLAVVRAAEQVLGRRGLRASLLDRFLRSLQNECNRWLLKIGGGKVQEIELSVDDKGRIVEQLVGLADPRYRAASGGERRRVDAAFILALSQISASDGVGTIFFDEVFDALDTDGVPGVARALRELAHDRAVVCISHSPQLVDHLQPDVHYLVENGRVLKQ